MFAYCLVYLGVLFYIYYYYYLFILFFLVTNSLMNCEPEILIATPERLLELVSLKAIDISGVSLLVYILLFGIVIL